MLSWKEIIQDYIIKHSDRIRKTTAPMRDHFGLKYFSYHRIEDSGKYTVLVDRPDWAECYVREQLYLNDPYLRHPSVYQSGLCLIESNGSEEYKEQILKVGKETLAVDVGIILIQKGKGFVEFFAFSGNKIDSCLDKLYLNHPHILKTFSAHFRKEMGTVLAKMQDENCNLINLKGDQFSCDEPIHLELPSEKILEYYRDLGLSGQFEKLSPREKQCMKLLAEDKSAKETAALLGLQTRSVEFYFENIKNKLSCSSKVELHQIARTLNQMQLL